MRNTVIDPAQIPGWGIDADPRNDPTYPMRDRSKDDRSGSGLEPTRNWISPARQEPQVEILSSIEHTRRPAAVGTSTPPSGLSGAIRRVAFRYSESQWAHWLLLILADRINMVEGVGQDLARGRVPNVFAEMGLGSELRYNRKRFLTNAAVGVGAVAVLIMVARALRD